MGTKSRSFGGGLELRADAYWVDLQPRGRLTLRADARMTGTAVRIALDRRKDEG